MSRELKTTLTIEAQTRGIDKIGEAGRAIDGLGKGAIESNPELTRLRTTLGELAQQQRLIAQFVQLKTALAATAAEMQKAQAATNAAARELKAKQQATQAATAAEQAGAASLAAARDQHTQLKAAIALARTELKALRAEAHNAGGANAALTARIKETQGQLAVLRTESQRTGAQVKTLAGEQRQLGAAVKEATTAQGVAEKAMQRAVTTAQSVKSVHEAQRTTLHRLRQSLTEAGISSTGLVAAQQRLTASIANARAAIEAQTQQVAKAVAAKRSMREGIESISSSLARMQRLYMAWIGGNQAVQYVRQLIGVADTYKNIAAQVALVNRTSEGYNLTLAETAELARRTYSNIETTTQLMGSLARAGAELGVSQQTVLRLTETINKANQVSGQSAASADAAVVQLIQGLQSGVLRGEEFNSMMEQAPRLARALADGLGVPVSALRAMANEGRLTTDVIIEALQSQAAAVDAEFAALPATVARAATNLRTAWMQFIGALDDGTGATAGVAAALDALAGVLDMLAGSTQELGAVVRMVLGFMAAQGVANLAAWAAGALTAGKTVGVLALAFTRLATAARLAWAAMASSPAFIIVGLVELVRALDYVISNYDELTEKVRTYFEERKKQQAAEAHQADTQALIAERLARISAQTGVTVTSMKELDAAVAAGKIHFDEASGAWVAGAGSLEQVERASGAAARQLREIDKALTAAAEKFEPVAEAAREALADVQQRLDAARNTIGETAGDIATTYGAMTAAVTTALDEQLAAIERRFEAERTALEASGASQREVIAATSRLLIEQLAAETAARQAATAETLRLVEEAAQAQREAAEAQAGTDAERRSAAQQVENEILANRRAALSDALAGYREHVDALNAEAGRHLAEVTRIEEAKAQLTMRTEDRVREILRGTMTEAEALEDRRRQAVEKQTAAREALARGEFDQARELAQQAMDLSAQVASAQTRDAQSSEEAKRGVDAAVRDMLASEKLMQEALDAEAGAHKAAAAEASTAREQIAGVIADTEEQVKQLSEQLAEGLKITLEVDTAKLTEAIDEAEALAAERELLVPVVADLDAAEKQLAEYQARIAAGEELPVDADFSAAEAALARFGDYARDHGDVALRIQTEEAQAAIGEVQAHIERLHDIRTESRHVVDHNAADAASAIDELDGRDTSSTHTIYIQRVEVNATGGLAGRGLLPHRFAGGGPASPWMERGAVPGAGDTDSVARTLPVGAYVLRKAAVAHYGRDGIAEMIARAKAALGTVGSAAASLASQAGAGVSALLMPGEQVIAPGDVARLGVQFFDGLNAMAVPPAPAAPVRFARGGYASMRIAGTSPADLAEANWRRLVQERPELEPDDKAEFMKWFDHLYDTAEPSRRMKKYGVTLGWDDIGEVYSVYSREIADKALERAARDDAQRGSEAQDTRKETRAGSRSGVAAPGAREGGRGAPQPGGGVGGGQSNGRGGASVVEHRVAVQIGQQSFRFGVAGAADADTALQMLRAIETAAGVSQ